MTTKAIKKIKKIWEFLENNYKGSEINWKLIIQEINKKADNKNDFKNMIKYAWANYEFYDLDEKRNYIKYMKKEYHIILN